ncbi:HPP family protein [Parashewanella spongiae]|uniref:HPP family protein n=1 Tax=Parashewanella spongiae TaxID=342950 RepID=A0A3A6TUB1_9GAMM|nr:HPP family protein [Parashewanella spongiae]RJY05083.1 HPP family protein [Parashewanella spongiae]
MKKIGYACTAGLGAALAIGLLSFVCNMPFNIALLMAPFGATAVLVFAVPESPLAQPRNVIFGHLLTAFIGLCFVNFFDATSLSIAIATGLAITLMILTKTIHPPAGANPILIMLTSQSWSFMITPVLLCSVTLVLSARFIYSCLNKYKKLGRKQPSFRKAQVDPHFSLFYLIPTIDPEHTFV